MGDSSEMTPQSVQYCSRGPLCPAEVSHFTIQRQFKSFFVHLSTSKISTCGSPSETLARKG